MKAGLLLTAASLTLSAVACSGANTGKASSNAAPALAGAKRIGDTVQFEPNSPQLSHIQVRAVQAERVPIGEVVAPGRIEANPNRVSRIALPVAGRIRNVLVGLGDSVQQGQPIIVIESSEVPALQAAHRQAEADLSQARTALAKAEADLQRARDLFDHQAIAQKEVLAAESEAARARAALEQAEAARDEITQRLRLLGIHTGKMDQTVVVPATVSGKVIQISVAAGEYRSDTAEPVMTLADLSTVWVAADVPENAIRFIRVREPVSITMPAFPDQTFTGRVAAIGDVVDAETRTIKVRAELSNPQGNLRPEMFAQIRSRQGEQLLPVAPKGAVLQQEGRSIIYVERAEGRFQEVPVTLGWHGPDRIAVASGIRAGDRIVVDGAMLLKTVAP